MANERTRVRSMQVREPKNLTTPSTAEWSEIEPTKRKWSDRLLRNVAVSGAILLLVVAARSSGSVDVQSVFGAIQSGASMQWDESLGKLTFVSNLLPESLRAVWNDQSAVTVYAPTSGEIAHAWTRSEPYIEIASVVRDVHAAQNGEVMSVAHGLDEELILRVRHDDGLETIYGNLAECHVDEGAYVYAGDILGTLLSGERLSFELRRDGRAIDPTAMLVDMDASWN